MNIQHLLTTLPQVRGWIEATLSEYKAQARPVASYGFGRLPQFYSAETLVNAFVVELPQVPMLPLTDRGLPEFAEYERGDYGGITYLNTYFSGVPSEKHGQQTAKGKPASTDELPVTLRRPAFEACAR